MPSAPISAVTVRGTRATDELMQRGCKVVLAVPVWASRQPAFAASSDHQSPTNNDNNKLLFSSPAHTPGITIPGPMTTDLQTIDQSKCDLILTITLTLILILTLSCGPWSANKLPPSLQWPLNTAAGTAGTTRQLSWSRNWKDG